MAAVDLTPLPDWGTHWEGLSDDDSTGLQMVGELGGAMAVSTILSRATSRDAVLSVFVDAGAYLAADEACELFVIMQDFMNGYFDRYRASASRWQRRRCARRVNDALSRMRAFAERNPQMVD